MFDPIINSKLNRLSEGGGYSETSQTAILEKAEYLVNNGVLMDIGVVELVEGKTYKVFLDGQVYDSICKATTFNEVHTIYLGNGILFGLEDTKEPFLAISNESFFELYVLAEMDAGNKVSHTISITTKTETIHPIDPKYLTGVCLPVVELSTTFKDGASYTAEENAKLKEVWEAGTPAIIKCSASLGITNIDDTRFVWNMSKTAFACAYMVPYGSSMLQIYSVDMGKTWGCTIEQIG